MTEPYFAVITETELGEILGHARRRAGLTQREAALRLGCSLRAVQAQEQGTNLEHVATFLNTLEAYGKVVKILDRTIGPPSRAWDGAGRITPRVSGG